MRNKEGDGDVFLCRKMMKFQNIKVWERWVVVCVIGVILEDRFCKRNEKRYGDVQRYGSKVNEVSEY